MPPSGSSKRSASLNCSSPSSLHAALASYVTTPIPVLGRSWTGAVLTGPSWVPQEHRHSFVRKNAVMAVFTIYKNFEFLIPDAPELIQTFMAAVCQLARPGLLRAYPY